MRTDDETRPIGTRTPLSAATISGVVTRPVDAASIRRVRAQLVGDPDLAGRSLARRLSQQADSWFESLAVEPARRAGR